MRFLFKLIPWLFLALFGVEIVVVMLPKKDGEYHVREFGRLPVLLNGRIQPFDSVARNSLLQIRSTGDVPLEEVPSWKFWKHPKKLRSSEWLLEVMARPAIADTRPIFLIHHAELLGELRLHDRGVEKSGLRYYTFNELRPLVAEIDEQARKAGEVKSEQRSSFQKQVIKLANGLWLYQRLKVTLQPEGADDFARQLADFEKNLGPAQAAARASESGKDFDREALRRVAETLKDFQAMARLGYPLTVPPLNPAAAPDQWQTVGASLLEASHTAAVHPAVTNYAAMATAYRQQQPDRFNRAVASYRQWLAPQFAKVLQKGRAEFYYNNLKPFLHAMIIYIFAFVLGCGALVTLAVAPNLSESLRRSAFYLVVLAGLVHTFGLVFRMALEGRPPVTNLYSSAIFIGWGAMVLGLVLERAYRVGLGSVVASLAGFVTLTIAHNLALGGDTMEMLRAVLDTNFWLATHVITITLGYSANFAAGLLAILYIFLGLFTPLLSQRINSGELTSAPESTSPPQSAHLPLPQGEGRGEGQPVAAKQSPIANRPSEIGNRESPIPLGQALSTMVYAIICFATLFSFVGTVLGGIWADQSWGRFWGWDPKENGALLIVLWNAIILHAHWGNLTGDRGVMNLAIFGNVITSFSWFGVNMLGIGLHSYGFMDAGAEHLLNFMVCQLVLLGNGMLSMQAWRSFSPGHARASGRVFLKLLGALDIWWLSGAMLWAGGVYSHEHAVWFAGVYQALPWLEVVGRASALIVLSLIWILVAVTGLALASPAEPLASAGSGASMPVK